MFPKFLLISSSEAELDTPRFFVAYEDAFTTIVMEIAMTMGIRPSELRELPKVCVMERDDYSIGGRLYLGHLPELQLVSIQTHCGWRYSQRRAIQDIEKEAP